MIEINANIQPGDSGGPLYASNGSIIGMDTAASSSFASQTGSGTQGYAIPINKAVSVAHEIDSGKSNSTIHQGYPAFLGVQVQSDQFGTSGGAVVAGVLNNSVLNNSAAAAAGLQQGDVITSVDGTSISSPSDLTSALASHKPGDKIKLGWTDSSGQSHSATVTLGSGPAD
jgi:S1-C subfamily serine protease